MITKNEILEESRYFMGENNRFTSIKMPKRRDMIKDLVKCNQLLNFEERACLKRELKMRKIKFSSQDDTQTLIGIAMKNKLDFNEFIL